jgi:hypothetical protein
MQISGSSALVAGGAWGLGEATARRLHADGALALTRFPLSDSIRFN